MAPLYRTAGKCPGSNTKTVNTRLVAKQRRNDAPGQMMLGWCVPCGSWIALNSNHQLRPHSKRREPK